MSEADAQGALVQGPDSKFLFLDRWARACRGYVGLVFRLSFVWLVFIVAYFWQQYLSWPIFGNGIYRGLFLAKVFTVAYFWQKYLSWPIFW